MMKKNISSCSIDINRSPYLSQVRTFFVIPALLLALILSKPGHTQMFDTIANSFNYHPKFLLKLDTRNSFIRNTYAKMNGVKVGVNFNNTTRLGIGYSWMSRDWDKIPATDTTSAIKLKFGYLAPFMEYNFYKSDPWFAEIQLQVGVGKANYKDFDPKEILSSSWTIIYEPAMAIEYRFLRYFGIGGGVGFRLVAKTSREIDETFTSPVYLFRFKIYFGDLYKEQIKNIVN